MNRDLECWSDRRVQQNTHWLAFVSVSSETFSVKSAFLRSQNFQVFMFFSLKLSEQQGNAVKMQYLSQSIKHKPVTSFVI